MIDTIQGANPEVTIATDIIAGFPGETEADFDETVELCRHYQFPCLYINQFFPRPGTPAASMTRVDPKEVKQRTKKLSELFRSYFPHRGKEGRRYLVLAAEESTDKQWFVAHNKSYDQILVPKRPELMGRTFEVEITETGKFHMMGRVIEGTLGPKPISLAEVPQKSQRNPNISHIETQDSPVTGLEHKTQATIGFISVAHKWTLSHPWITAAAILLAVDLCATCIYRSLVL